MNRRLIAFLLVFAACSSDQTQPARPETTIENLRVAHAVAYRRAEYYAGAATAAQTERLGNLAAMFTSIARSEQVHAQGHEMLLKNFGASTDTSKSPHLPLGSLRQILKMGVSLENTEVKGIYPPMIVAAGQEQQQDASIQFAQFMKADERHLALISEAQERGGVLPIHRYCVCVTCGFIAVDQDTMTTCTVCGKNVWERM